MKFSLKFFVRNSHGISTSPSGAFHINFIGNKSWNIFSLNSYKFIVIWIILRVHPTLWLHCSWCTPGGGGCPGGRAGRRGPRGGGDLEVPPWLRGSRGGGGGARGSSSSSHDTACESVLPGGGQTLRGTIKAARHRRRINFGQLIIWKLCPLWFSCSH